MIESDVLRYSSNTECFVQNVVFWIILFPQWSKSFHTYYLVHPPVGNHLWQCRKKLTDNMRPQKTLSNKGNALMYWIVCSSCTRIVGRSPRGSLFTFLEELPNKQKNKNGTQRRNSDAFRLVEEETSNKAQHSWKNGGLGEKTEDIFI